MGSLAQLARLILGQKISIFLSHSTSFNYKLFSCPKKKPGQFGPHAIWAGPNKPGFLNQKNNMPNPVPLFGAQRAGLKLLPLVFWLPENIGNAYVCCRHHLNLVKRYSVVVICDYMFLLVGYGFMYIYGLMIHICPLIGISRWNSVYL